MKRAKELASDTLLQERIFGIEQTLDAIIHGDFTCRIEGGDDEWSGVLTRVNSLVEKFESTTKQMTQDLSEIVSQTFYQTQNLVERANSLEGQTDKIKKVLISTEQLALATEELAQNTSAASVNASAAKDVSNNAIQEVKTVLADVEAVGQGFGPLLAESEQQRHYVDQIGKMTILIQNVASQTHLLALNAAIEAARAGEQGRSFAVVAAEIRKLADQTKESVQEINNRVSSLVEQTSRWNNMLTTVSAKIEGAAGSTHSVGGDLDKIARSVELTEVELENIAPVAEEQSAAFQEMNTTLAKMNEMLDRMMQDNRESENSLRSIGNLTDSMRGKLASFKVGLCPADIIRLALTDHQLWVWKLDNALAGGEMPDPNLAGDYHRCRFGQWYDSEKSNISSTSEFRELAQPHAQFHRIVAEALLEKRQGHQDKAEAKFEEMKVVSQHVITKMERLLKQLT